MPNVCGRTKHVSQICVAAASTNSDDIFFVIVLFCCSTEIKGVNKTRMANCQEEREILNQNRIDHLGSLDITEMIGLEANISVKISSCNARKSFWVRRLVCCKSALSPYLFVCLFSLVYLFIYLF